MDASTTEKTVARRVMVVVLALIAVCFVVLLQGSAMAQQDPYAEESPSVLPTRLEQSSEPKGDSDDDQVLHERLTNNAAPGTLPFTGADLTLFIGTGFAAIGTGTLLVRGRRSSRSKR